MEVNGFAAALSASLDAKIMDYRSWYRTEVRKAGGAELTLCLINEDGMDFPVIHGEFYDDVKITPENRDLQNILARGDGSYAFVLPHKDSLAFARDQLGTKPLYYARNGRAFAVASDARVLRVIGDVYAAEPGVLYRADSNSMTEISFNTTNLNIESGEDAVSMISRLLNESVRRRVSRKRRVALGFSGGIDSAILAVLASRYTKVDAVTVCAKNSLDYRRCEGIADRLGLDLEMIVVDDSIMKSAIEDLSNMMKFDGAMDAGIASTIYTMAKFARDMEDDALVLGQLADELFGGYARYLKFLRSSKERVRAAMFNDVKNAHIDNFCRDEMAASPFTKIILPYASLPLVKYAINLPIEMKMNLQNNIRKIILREVAKEIGMDDDLANMEKKAMQFSSGIFKIASRLGYD